MKTNEQKLQELESMIKFIIQNQTPKELAAKIIFEWMQQQSQPPAMTEEQMEQEADFTTALNLIVLLEHYVTCPPRTGIDRITASQVSAQALEFMQKQNPIEVTEAHKQLLQAHAAPATVEDGVELRTALNLIVLLEHYVTCPPKMPDDVLLASRTSADALEFMKKHNHFEVVSHEQK